MPRERARALIAALKALENKRGQESAHEAR